MDEYPEGHVKKDPVTQWTATKLPAGSLLGEWGVMTLDRGAHYWPTEMVAHWDDMVIVVDAGG